MDHLLREQGRATVTAAHAGEWTLRTEHDDVLDSEEKRRELLARLDRGETFSLLLDMVAYSQAPGVTNRKFVRFANPAALAATGVGSRFLRDHNQWEMKAVGGTILASAAQMNGAATEIRQTALLVKRWALRSALLGLLKAFSIGWGPLPAPGKLSPEVICTVCSTPVQQCHHWRGDVVAGRVVEWEFQNAELLETSAVPIPAVRETGPIGVRESSPSALAAELSTFGVTVSVPDALHTEEHDMDKIALALGLTAGATEEAILAALKERDGQVARLTGELAAAKAEAQAASTRELEAASKLAQASSKLAQTTEALADEKARNWADGLVEAGKLTSPEGKIYELLVAEHKKNPEKADELAASMPVVTAVGRALQTERKPDSTPATTPTGEPDFSALALTLNAHDQRLARVAKTAPADYVRANYDDLATEYGWPKRPR